HLAGPLRERTSRSLTGEGEEEPHPFHVSTFRLGVGLSIETRRTRHRWLRASQAVPMFTTAFYEDELASVAGGSPLRKKTAPSRPPIVEKTAPSISMNTNPIIRPTAPPT